MLMSWTIVILSIYICISNHHLYILYMQSFYLKKSFGDEYIHYFDFGDGILVCTIAQTSNCVHFRYVQFVVCQLYLYKALKYLTIKMTFVHRKVPLKARK